MSKEAKHGKDVTKKPSMTLKEKEPKNGRKNIIENNTISLLTQAL